MTNFTPLALQAIGDTPESARAILKSLDRMAHKVLESSKSDREAVYELMRARLGDAGRVLNLSDKEVADFEVNYMTWLHALADTIERGGGAPEGKA